MYDGSNSVFGTAENKQTQFPQLPQLSGHEIDSTTVSGGACDSHAKIFRKGLSVPFLFRKRKRKRKDWGEDRQGGEGERRGERKKRGVFSKLRG